MILYSSTTAGTAWINNGFPIDWARCVHCKDMLDKEGNCLTCKERIMKKGYKR